jgi:integrase
VREDDPDWHALFATIAVTGIRRGEAVGVTWAATDLTSGALEIRQTITKAGSKVIVKAPKSRRSRRVVPLPAALVVILAEHRTRQDERRRLLSADWQELDLVFPNDVGRYRYPDYVSTRFATYARRAGLPHIGAARAPSLPRVRPRRQRERARHDQRPARPCLDRCHLKGLHPHAQGRRPCRGRRPRRTDPPWAGRCGPRPPLMAGTTDRHQGR